MSSADSLGRPESFSREFSLDFPNDRGGKALAQRAVEKFGAEHGWPYEILHELDLILEEWLTNIISYGGLEESRALINVTLRLHGDVLAVSVTDPGIEFDPVSRPEPDMTIPVEERPIGGMGILMIKRLTDGLSWNRESACNVLRFRKSIVTPKLRH